MNDKEEILALIYRSGKGRREIERDLGYSKYYIDQMVAKEGNETFLTRLREYVGGLEREKRSLLEQPREPYPIHTIFDDCDYISLARGRGMEPLILQNAYVAGKRLLNPHFIVYGEIYIVQTSNGMESVRYIRPDPNDAEGILLVEADTQADPTPLRRADIVGLFRAMYVVNPL